MKMFKVPRVKIRESFKEKQGSRWQWVSQNPCLVVKKKMVVNNFSFSDCFLYSWSISHKHLVYFHIKGQSTLIKICIEQYGTKTSWDLDIKSLYQLYVISNIHQLSHMYLPILLCCNTKSMLSCYHGRGNKCGHRD